MRRTVSLGKGGAAFRWLQRRRRERWPHRASRQAGKQEVHREGRGIG